MTSDTTVPTPAAAPPASVLQTSVPPTSVPPASGIKERHRAMWASGDYGRLADDLLLPLGETLVNAIGIGPGQRVLDVASGTGNAAIPAARTGADVVASDLTPELLDAGRERADREGVRLSWEVADAEHLPYPDAAFDAVFSSIGIMFAPFHQDAADELVRVCRPGGRVGVASWTPEGFVGRMLITLKPYAPPPPEGAQPPPLWGQEEHLRGLLGDRVADLRLERRTVCVDHFASGAEYRDYFKATYGPTIVTYRRIADQPEQVAALDAALAALADEHLRDGVMDWEYLLATGTRA